jgi:hypothetical protein
MLLLFASSIVIFYLNRGLIFEQKASANQLRSTTAFEAAEAGIEWATGMLNTPQGIDSDCLESPGVNASFRRRYIQTGYPANLAVTVAASSFPGCKLDGIALACHCPQPNGSEQVAMLSGAVRPGFTIAFASVIDPATGTVDPTAVRVTSTGCSAQASACKPATTTAATTGASDAHATVSVILKLVPTLRAAPTAALTCGGSCAVGGSATLINTDTPTNGQLVHAGASITLDSDISTETLPGQPVPMALTAADPSLAAHSGSDAACAASAMFTTYFGRSLEQYAQPGGDVISIPGCTDAGTCGDLVGAAYQAGWRSFYFPDGLALDGGAPFSQLGGASDGVRLVSAAPIRIDGALTIHGLVFSNSPRAGDLSTGSVDIHGALVACGDYDDSGSGVLRYTPSTLTGSGLVSGVMVRVPGSWRDF